MTPQLIGNIRQTSSPMKPVPIHAEPTPNREAPEASKTAPTSQCTAMARAITTVRITKPVITTPTDHDIIENLTGRDGC